jgi:inosine triphosphate pyrophosphatase
MIFITGNVHKLTEYQHAIPTITSQKLDLTEVQAQTVEEISAAKAEEGFHKLGQACFVEDVALEMEVLGGLPGPYIKWFLGANTPEHISDLANQMNQTKATAKAVLGLKIDSAGAPIILVGEVQGQIVPPRGNSDFGFDNIFQPDGAMKTFGEMTKAEKHQYSHRGRAIAKLQEFIKNHHA